MSQFRDTFTKEDSENLLEYDDAAFLFFLATILLCFLLYLTYVLFCGKFGKKDKLKNFRKGLKRVGKNSGKDSVAFCKCAACHDKASSYSKSSLRLSFSLSFVLKIAALVCLWIIFFMLLKKLATIKPIAQFDPFEILDVSSNASVKEIKKAYRLMSLKYHPDKNPNDPTAAAKFVIISKAYQSLTDDVARSNYEKYGNPDGPGIMKVGIGLPSLLIDEKYQILILCLFFIVLLFVIPLMFISYYRRQKKYAPNGVQLASLYFFSASITEASRLKSFPELLCCAGELRDLVIRPSDNADMVPLIENIEELKKRSYQAPNIVRNYYLILAHMSRRHELLSEKLSLSLDDVLEHSMKLTLCMLEIGTMRNFIQTVLSILSFRRSLIQGLDGNHNCAFLQIPHFEESVIAHLKRGKNAVKSFAEFVAQKPEDRKGLVDMDEQKIADIIAYCDSIPRLDVKITVTVDDEQEIVVGDFVSVIVEVTRLNLKEGQQAGPVHAPLIKFAKYEEWWIYVCEKTSGSILGYVRGRNLDRVFEERIQFIAEKQGVNHLTVYLTCDSIEGIDLTYDVEYRAFNTSEVKREFYVHPEDQALDNEPTLFQQLMNQLDESENSDTDDEDDKHQVVEDFVDSSNSDSD